MTDPHAPPTRAPTDPASIPLTSDPHTSGSRTLRVVATDGAVADVLLVLPAGGVGAACRLLYWLPAMGVPARHYLPLAQALAARGVAVALHEWRGIGSSDRRAGRRQDWSYRELLACDLPPGLAAAREQLPQAVCWIGGHSLGGQLAALYASEHAAFAGLVLVASGAPYWRRFRHGWLIRTAYGAAPLLARLLGHLPGRRIGFGGNEARGVVSDWARSGRSGRYTVAGTDRDWERQLAALALPVLAVRLADDWLGPAASLAWLLDKMPDAMPRVAELEASALGVPADHFSWIKAPAPVADMIASWLAEQGALEDRSGGGTSC